MRYKDFFAVISAFFSTFSMSSTLFADVVTDVQEIDQGACWLQVSDAGATWKIASFNDHSSGVLSAELIGLNLSPRIEAALRNLGVTNYNSTDFGIHFFCSGGGHQIVLNLKNSEHPVCITSDLSLQRFEVDSNFSASSDALCERAQTNEVILFARPNVHPQVIANWLMSSIHKNDIDKLDLRDTWLVVHLRSAWALKESVLIQKWKSDSELMNRVSMILPNSKTTFNGQSVLLGRGNFQGFGSKKIIPGQK